MVLSKPVNNSQWSFGVSNFVTSVAKKIKIASPKTMLSKGRYLFVGWYESEIACQTETTVECCKEQISLETLPLSCRDIKTTIFKPLGIR